MNELLKEDLWSEIFLPFMHIKSGSTPLVDLVVLAALVRKKAPAHIFEIGTFEGLTSVVFAKNGRPGVKIYTLDLPPQKDVLRTRRSIQAQSVKGYYESGYLIDIFGCSLQVERIFADSALFDFKKYENLIDIFFIDGAHTAEYIALDSLNALRSITSNGWVIWHDCFVPDVLRVIKRIAKHHPVFHICGTAIALILEKPGNSFPWEILETKIS